ncbi:MAG: stage 0 sporulation protein [Clostridia bacterium]|nr:stage 0 sporulation protein [Clostridia bacterium]
MQIAQIKFKQSQKNVFIEVDDCVNIKDKIVIEFAKSLLIADVLAIVNDGQISEDVKFVRRADEADISKYTKLNERACEVKDLAKNLAQKYNSDMKIVDVEFTLDGNKVIISFVCEDRVDFRDLVKDLAAQLKLRIELRQIGIRDQAKLVGCMGICGKECCCSQYLNDFDKVSIKMAKNQNLSLNPTKISGTCGRLMCCLSYENETYVELAKTCPKINAKVQTPDGDGTVISNNILKQTSLCRIEKGDDIKVSEYSVSDIKAKKDYDDRK